MKHLALLLAILSLPAGAVTRRAACMVGDSLTYGYTFDSTPIPDRLADLTGKPVVNMGVGSNLSTNISARYTRYCSPYLYKVAIWEGCTNDLDAGVSGATCWATTEAWVEAVEAAGQVAVVLTVFPRWGHANWTSDEETQRLDYNSRATTYVASHPSVILVNMESVLGDGATPPALKVAYDWGDHLHINGTGMQAAAEAIYGAAVPW